MSKNISLYKLTLQNMLINRGASTGKIQNEGGDTFHLVFFFCTKSNAKSTVRPREYVHYGILIYKWI